MDGIFFKNKKGRRWGILRHRTRDSVDYAWFEDVWASEVDVAIAV